MGGKALRSIGLERATLHLHWKAAVYNLRRLCSLKALGPFHPRRLTRLLRHNYAFDVVFLGRIPAQTHPMDSACCRIVEVNA
jgi:hypothetical protein